MVHCSGINYLAFTNSPQDTCHPVLMPPRRPNYVPYPTQNDCAPAAGVCMHPGPGSDATMANFSTLKNLLKDKNSAHELYRIIIGCEQGQAKYDHRQLWFYSSWHTSEDPKEHSMFRLFSDVGLAQTAGKEPWNSAVYHVYKDGQVRSWTYGHPKLVVAESNSNSNYRRSSAGPSRASYRPTNSDSDSDSDSNSESKSESGSDSGSDSDSDSKSESDSESD
ncbi:hypothetical protein B0H16DRAFT_347261 [Mycena metata]|uniref:Uncharacterized protein n=1 Tax=Mycena metata TaxID=1033252 RepID=A0AAD7HKC5_9AGAR|nr:hypothetical protein B0H16DRAFT_347261 [Mycena metata]